VVRRFKTGQTPAETEMSKHLANARSSLQAAYAVAHKARTNRRVVNRRVAEAEYKIRRALGSIGSIRGLQPAYDLDDPDLMPEEDKRPPTPAEVPAKGPPQLDKFAEEALVLGEAGEDGS